MHLSIVARCAIVSVLLPFSVHPAPAASQSQTASPVQDRERALNALFNEYWQYTLKASPESATFYGDTRYNDQWSDYTANAYNSNLARESQFILRLGAIDTTGMPEQERLSAELLLRSLVDDQEAARFREWQMPVDQFNGPHTLIPQTIAAMPFTTAKDYDNYIARLSKVPAVFAQVQEAMSAGVDSKRVKPRFLMEKVVEQLTALATAKPEESAFAEPLKTFPASVPAAEQKRIRKDALDAVSQQVQPAYDRFARYLKAQYIPACRDTPGIASIPDGAAYYAFLIRRSTTLSKSADEIHALGLAEVKRDEAEMLSIAKSMGYSDLKTFNAAVKSDPKLHPGSAEQMLDAYKKPIAQMKPKLPALFGRLPKAPLEVIPVPDYMAAQQAQAYYQPGTPGGKRPGQVFVNTYHYAERGLENAEVIAYHEGIPGHHLQISIAQELTGLPEFRKEAGYTAFAEGWGLYSEQLGKDVGFFTDPYNNYGRLEADIWRAIRLVVDTGVHAKGWTRQQMVDFFHEHSTLDEQNIQAETDRYIAWPAQALGYKIGQLKLLELRERAKSKLGPKFDIRNFHDEVLDSGALPLDVLEKRVDLWIAAGGPAQPKS